jgi:hypothetical protein
MKSAAHLEPVNGERRVLAFHHECLRLGPIRVRIGGLLQKGSEILVGGVSCRLELSLTVVASVSPSIVK